MLSTNAGDGNQRQLHDVLVFVRTNERRLSDIIYKAEGRINIPEKETLVSLIVFVLSMAKTKH